MKEIRITQVEGGYIVVVGAGDGQQKVQVTPNFGRAVKSARELFGETKDSKETPETAVASE